MAFYKMPVIFVVIFVLVVALIYSSIFTSGIFAAAPDPNWDPNGTCGAATRNPETGTVKQTCCWTERTGPPKWTTVNYCQTCSHLSDSLYLFCDPPKQQLRPGGISPEEGVLQEPSAPPAPPLSGPAAPVQDGGILQQPSGEGVAPPITQDQSLLPEGELDQTQEDQGAAELPAITEPATVEEESPVPVCQDGLEFNEDLGFCVPTECPEGQVLNEDSGICVLEEPEAMEEEPEQSEPKESDQQQSAEEGDNSEDNSNN